MDSKILRNSILCCTGIILLMTVLVWFVNRQSEQTGEAIKPSASQSQASSVEETTGQIGDSLHAFMEDETFFDPQENEWLKEKREEKNRLSMIVTSVEKDLRVQIVDGTGEVVSGKTFELELKDHGTYRDDNQDGLIHIRDLASGEYTLTLLSMEPYQISSVPVKAKVKEKVEYYPIKDISLLIKTEEEVVAANEDTMEWGAIEDEDETEILTPILDKKNALVGIDVSKWNGEIDWEEVARGEVSFTIIRAGYRGSKTGSLVVDPYFEENMKGAGQAGLYRGVYFFTQAINEVEAVEEASMVLELLRPYKIQFPIYIDTEGAGGNGRADGLDQATRTAVCEAFCNTIRNAGYEAGVYASRSWYQHNVDASQLEKYHIWLAEYRSIPLYEGYYEMWQHTSKGNVAGVNGKVDMNLSYWKPTSQTD